MTSYRVLTVEGFSSVAGKINSSDASHLQNTPAACEKAMDDLAKRML
jgi:hypothetical protein